MVHGDKDEVVPVAEDHGLRELAEARKLPIAVEIYPKVGHAFQTAENKFDLKAMMDAQRRMTEHLQKHLKP